MFEGKSKEYLVLVGICFVCFILFAVFALVGMTGGFKFLDQSEEPASDTEGHCCTECVESIEKFIGFVFLVPLAIFIVGFSIAMYFFGWDKLKIAGREITSSGSSTLRSQSKSLKELKISENLFAIGFFVFALVAVILTFTSGKGLYSSHDYKVNSQSPPPTQSTCSSINGKWCVACKPEFWKLFLASAGAGMGVWICATGFLIASKKHASSSSSSSSSFSTSSDYYL